MNAELRELLRSMASDDGAREWEWDRVVLVRNGRKLPFFRNGGPLREEAHGFDLLLLGPDFRPRHYCKVRPREDPKLTHASRILEALATDPVLAGAVPPTRSRRTRNLQVQVTAYLTGPRLDHLLADMPTEAWTAAVDEVLDLAEAISRRLSGGAIDLRPRGANEALPLRELARSGLDHLEEAGFIRGVRPLLEEALARAGTLPMTAQHGDLWPGNVIRSNGGSWQILDFEEFGRVRMPLFDTLHMLRTSELARTGTPPGTIWLARLRSGGSEAAAARRILDARRRALSLSPAATAGALVHYLVELAAWLHGVRRAPPDYWEPVLAELDHVAGVLRSGAALEDLLLPGSGGPSGGPGRPSWSVPGGTLRAP